MGGVGVGGRLKREGIYVYIIELVLLSVQHKHSMAKQLYS